MKRALDFVAIVVVFALSSAACETEDPVPSDAASDAGHDAASDAGPDLSSDAGHDASSVGPCSRLTAGDPCRPAVGPCDITESCTGTSDTCPADSFAFAGTVCRASTGSCDIPESCSGVSDACPVDAMMPGCMGGR